MSGKTKTFRVVVNGQAHEVEVSDGVFSIGNEAFRPDVSPNLEDGYLMFLNNETIQASLVSQESKKRVFRINGLKYETVLSDEHDLLLEELGMGSMADGKAEDTKAPMPGLVIGVNVSPGDEVKKGDALLVLEAMKMENVIKASADGMVKSIEVAEGAAVEKNQVLVSFE